MAIISISRHQAALGDETAKAIMKTLDFRLVDKHKLEEQIKSYGGLSDMLFEKYDERKPVFFAGLTNAPDIYLHYLKTAMFDEAVKGNCIFVGRGAGYIFQSLPGMVSVHLSAPYDIRMERVKGFFHCDEKRARQLIDQRDSDRSGFMRYFFNADWTDPANYHLCLNTGLLSPEACAEIIKNLLEHTLTEEVKKLHEKRLGDLILSHRIEHHLIYEKKIQINFFEAKVEDERITLFGVTQSHALLAAATSAASELKGDREIVSEIHVIQS